MDTSYEAHRPSQTLLTVTHQAWCNRNYGKNALVDYDEWALRNQQAKKNRMASSIFFLFAVIATVIQFEIGYLSFYWLTLIGVSLLISYLNKREADDFIGQEPYYWNTYQEELSELLKWFPVLECRQEKIREFEDAKRIICAELEPRGRQIAAKQKMGFIVDAAEERDVMMAMYYAADEFNFTNHIDDYFPTRTSSSRK